jgi:hypothetical protein
MEENLNESLETHNTLNPKLFDEQDLLKEDVREGLIDIANTFIEDIKENDIPIEVMDLWLVGSNASYNYSDNSDIDVHIIANMDDIDCNGLLTIVYNYAKSDFNKKHKITVKGIPVEVYIESRSSSAITNGIYSLMNNEWVKFPEKINIDIDFDPDTNELYKEKFEEVTSAIESDSSEEVQKTIDDLYLLRKSALSTDGEFGEGNLVFKEFRNNGMLEKLKDHKREIQDKELTVESVKDKKIFVKKDAGNCEIGNAIFNSMQYHGNGVGNQQSVAEDVEEEPFECDFDIEAEKMFRNKYMKDTDVEEDFHDKWNRVEWDDENPPITFSGDGKVFVHYDKIDNNYDEKTYDWDLETTEDDVVNILMDFMTEEDWGEVGKKAYSLYDEVSYVYDNIENLSKKYYKEIMDSFEEKAVDELSDYLYIND